MPNYSLVANTQFRNRSFEDMMRPLAMYTEEYNNQENAIGELEDKANVWEGMANEQTDPVSYAQFRRYADDLRNQATALANNGLTPGTRRDILNLRKRYSSEIVPIENAYNTRKQQADEQRKALLQNPTLLLSRRADTTSLDDYLANPELGYDSYSGALLTQQVGTAAAAIAKELKDYGNGKSLDGFTKTWLQQHGYTAGEVAQAINNPDSPRSAEVLNTIVNNVMADSGIPQWADRSTLNQAYDYARQGLWQAVGQTQIGTYSDEAAKMNAELEKQKALARYTAGLKGNGDGTDSEGGVGVNPIPLYSPVEQNEYSRAMKEYNKYFTFHSDGSVTLNTEGVKAYKGKVWKGGTSNSITGATSQSYQDDSDFKKFVDKYLGKNAGEAISNNKPGLYKEVGNLYKNYVNEHQTSAFDARKVTEFDYALTDDESSDLKKAVVKAMAGNSLRDVDFNSKDKLFDYTGDELDMADFIDDKKYKILALRMSPYGTAKTSGNSLIVEDAEGKIRRVELPHGINPVMERRLEGELNIARAAQEMLISGMRPDPNNEKIRVPMSENDKHEAMQAYADAIDRSYMYLSQLGVLNKSKDREYSAYSSR